MFSDPLDGTGCTRDEARRAVGRQRSLENDIRKLKRRRNALEDAGLDIGNTDALIRARQAELRAHIAGNSAILRRERWREQVASAAAGMPERFKRETKSGRFVYTQDEVDAAVEKYAGNVRFGAEPKANPRLKAYGKTHVVEVFPGYRKTVSIEIGPQKDGGGRVRACRYDPP